ncbi:MAG: transposase [Anaerolineales bacterium]|nr:MAG: transposase [Anaerolineales bacterium]WKZ37037.1 MAG: transposase [Anaerolineales bacterium]WKZ37417.1 MAG: transposase [Anaerolineales bacterium]
MSKPTIKITRTIHSEQVLNAFMTVVRKNLPLELRNTRITAEDILYVLAYANVHRLSIESACLELQNAPSGNRLREVLAQSLPDRAGLQNRLNRIFHRQLHPSVWKCKRDFNVAIDLTLIPYHGQPYEDRKEIVRSAPKSGTTHFHGYATVSIVRDHRRYVVALRFIEHGEDMADIVRWLLKRLKTLKFRIRRVFLDKGFCSKPVFKVLDQHKVSFVTPIPVRGKSGGVRTLFQGKSRVTTYTFNSPKYGIYTVQAVVVQRYSKGRYGRHKSKWFAYAVSGLPSGILPAQVFELYRQRFGIESSYRQMNQVRARTSTRNPVIRLLLVGLAFVLFNLYIALRQNLASALKTPLESFNRFWLSLRRVAFLLSRAIERFWGATEVIQHQSCFVLS